MRRFRPGVIPAFALLAVACSTGGSTPPSLTGTSQPAIATRIDVQLTDALKIEPAVMAVPVGVPVTFVVTNTGLLEHEFYLGDEAAQAEHDREMAASGMAHDEPEGIGVDPGETKELVFTFAQAGGSIAGCHVVGHYGAGMKATITVTP